MTSRPAYKHISPFRQQTNRTHFQIAPSLFSDVLLLRAAEGPLA